MRTPLQKTPEKTLGQDRTATPDQFRAWIAPWAGVIGGTIAPAFVSEFGFWFLRRPEGHVEMLDVFTGTRPGG